MNVGGVKSSAVLIDSGASCNLIVRATWEFLKKKESSVNQIYEAKSLLLMGRRIQLKWLEHSKYKLRVKSVASIELMSSQLSNQGRWLLGKDTTRKLRVVRVSPMEEEVCLLTIEGDEADFR